MVRLTALRIEGFRRSRISFQDRRLAAGIVPVEQDFKISNKSDDGNNEGTGQASKEHGLKSSDNEVQQHGLNSLPLNSTLRPASIKKA